MDRLVLENISKSYYYQKGKLQVIDDLSLKVKEGEIVAIVGPSGTGKSTILNIIAGLVKQDSGTISVNGKIGYMFQHDLLFEWKNVYNNLFIGLEINNKVTKQDIDKAVALLEKYDLVDFKKSLPNELSGGMRQRIALIRTLMTSPDILLLDEPFSALDAQTRIKVSNDVYKTIKEEKLTAILVTHDISEAISLADRIIILSKRPAKVVKQYEIKFDNLTPLEKRTNPLFLSYFNQIWNDIE
ncbi:MAG: ABC transporter ATP-binding protein [Bacilli bacterium]|nr:ABC transporter ATP-binding protein [Bacilli bacterium]